MNVPISSVILINDLTVVLMFVLKSDHRTFESIQDLTCHGFINHDIVVGFCSEQLMRLAYYNHLGSSGDYKNLSRQENRTQDFSILKTNVSFKFVLLL